MRSCAPAGAPILFGEFRGLRSYTTATGFQASAWLATLTHRRLSHPPLFAGVANRRFKDVSIRKSSLNPPRMSTRAIAIGEGCQFRGNNDPRRLEILRLARMRLPRSEEGTRALSIRTPLPRTNGHAGESFVAKAMRSICVFDRYTRSGTSDPQQRWLMEGDWGRSRMQGSAGKTGRTRTGVFFESQTPITQVATGHRFAIDRYLKRECHIASCQSTSFLFRFPGPSLDSDTTFFIPGGTDLDAIVSGRRVRYRW